VGSTTVTDKRISRRGFIRITAAAAGIGATAWAARALLDGSSPARVEETRLLMGSVANLTLLTKDRGLGERALAATFDAMQRLESVLSRHLPSSQLSQLNRTGFLAQSDAALVAVVERAVLYSQLTGGAFDISVEPLLAAYRQAAEAGKSLTAGQRASLISLVGYRNLQVEGAALRLTKPGMALTLDGIAKGYVIDQGADSLRSWGFDQILVEVGGDLMSGRRVDGDWQIGIRAPRAETAHPWVGVARLAQKAMATSGDYINTFSQDYANHHIIDPRQGVSPAELASATVLAPSAMDADALSTSLLVLGPAKGLALVDTLPGVEALMVGKDQQVHVSSGFNWDPA
jgi:thiamine biosynthesis lipoprotein